MGLFTRKKKISSAVSSELKETEENKVNPQLKNALDYIDVRFMEDDSKRIPLMFEYAEAGVPQALYDLGKMYLTGNGIEHNPEKAKEFLLKAGKSGAGDALALLAQICISEAFEEVIPEKVERFGQEECQKRFNKKYDTGVSYLAWALAKGNESAIDIYTGSFPLGWNEGDFGEVLKEATNTAFASYKEKLFEEASGRAFYVLGILSLRGVALPQNIDMAKEFFGKSAALGNTQAKDELKNPLLALPGDEEDE